MSLTMIAPVEGFLSQKAHRHVECWKVTTTHGATIAPVLVTSHNRPISFDIDGTGLETYTPATGFDS